MNLRETRICWKTLAEKTSKKNTEQSETTSTTLNVYLCYFGSVFNLLKPTETPFISAWMEQESNKQEIIKEQAQIATCTWRCGVHFSTRQKAAASCERTRERWKKAPYCSLDNTTIKQKSTAHFTTRKPLNLQIEQKLPVVHGAFKKPEEVCTTSERFLQNLRQISRRAASTVSACLKVAESSIAQLSGWAKRKKRDKEDAWDVGRSQERIHSEAERATQLEVHSEASHCVPYCSREVESNSYQTAHSSLKCN